MDRICIYIELPTYLAQWYIHDAGGSFPVVPRKNSIERRILEVFLQIPPASYVPPQRTAQSVSIALPDSRVKPPQFYFYLPPRAMAQLCKCIRDRFLIELWKSLHSFGYIGRRRDNLIYQWMEDNGIDTTERNWNAIAKIYLRQYKSYLQRQAYHAKKDAASAESVENSQK